MKSISRHLYVSQLVLTMIAGSLFCMGLYLYVQHVLIQNLDKHLTEQANTLSQLIKLDNFHQRVGCGFGRFRQHGLDPPANDPTSTTNNQEPDLILLNNTTLSSSYFIFNARGDLEIHSNRANIHDLDFIPLDQKKQTLGNFVNAEDIQQRYIHTSFYPQFENGRICQQPWSLVVTKDKKDVRATLKILVSSCLICGSGLLLVSALFIIWNTKKGLAPLKKIAADVSQLDSNQLDYRFAPDQHPEELAEVLAKLNELLEKLETSFQRERSFSGSAAHELRTPLAELKAIAQVGTGWKPEQTTSPVTFFQDSESIITRMQSMISALLTLIDDRPEAMNIEWAQVNLTTVVQRELRKLSDQDAHDHFTLHAPDQPLILADQALITGILNNIIKNALEYADSNTPIVCRISQTDNSLSLSLTNQCSSLSPADVEQMSDAFWRKDSSRTGTSHQGLGIGIAQTYARCMNGELTVQFQEPDLITVTLTGLELTGLECSSNVTV